MPRNSLLKLVRQVHLYFGVFISPALLFFAFTGCVQTLGLHEPSSNYKPPAILASLGQIHKKQTYIIPVRRGAGSPEGARSQAPRTGSPEPDARTNTPTQRAISPEPSGRQAAGQADGAAHRSASSAAANTPAQQAPTLRGKQKQHLPLKIFFVVVSLGLFISTLTGMYMAYVYDRNKILVTALLIAGVITPIVLVRF